MIRKYKDSDFNFWVKVRNENYSKVNSKNYSKKLLRELMLLPPEIKEYMIVKEVERKVVGTASLGKNGEIGNLFVLPEFQGKGFGKELLKKLESKKRNMFVYSSTTAKGFYEKQGLKVKEKINDELNGKRFELALMIKPLKSNNKKH